MIHPNMAGALIRVAKNNFLAHFERSVRIWVRNMGQGSISFLGMLVSKVAPFNWLYNGGPITSIGSLGGPQKPKQEKNDFRTLWVKLGTMDFYIPFWPQKSAESSCGRITFPRSMVLSENAIYWLRMLGSKDLYRWSPYHGPLGPGLQYVVTGIHSVSFEPGHKQSTSLLQSVPCMHHKCIKSSKSA